MLIKKVRVTNEKNVVVQVPIVVSDMHWQLKQGDSLEVHYDELTKEIRIIPQKIRAGSTIDETCEELLG